MLDRRMFLNAGVLFLTSPYYRTAVGFQKESPPIDTSSIVPKKILQGSNYSLQSPTQLKAHHFEFQIVTRWGVLPATGLNQLRVRLYEMQCLELAMDERWQMQELQGVFDSLEKTPEGALLILKDPLGTLLRTPKGLQKLVTQRLNEADKRAGGSTRRELASRLGCDPETTNPLLRHMLDEISTRNKVGKVAARIGMSLAVPGLGLLALNTDIKKTVATYLPSEINLTLDQSLAKAGVAQPIREQFLTNSFITTTERLVFIEYLRMLSDIPGYQSLVESAATVTSVTQALAVLEETAHLVLLHRQQPLTRIQFIGLTSCQQKPNAQIVVASVDYLSATKDVATLASVIRRKFPSQQIELQVMGTCSTGARDILKRSNITVKDNLRGDFTIPPLKEEDS